MVLFIIGYVFSAVLFAFEIFIAKRYIKVENKVNYIFMFLSFVVSIVYIYFQSEIYIYNFLVLLVVGWFNLIVLCDIKSKLIPNKLLIVLNILGLSAGVFNTEGNLLIGIVFAVVIPAVCYLVGKIAKNMIGSGDLFCISGLLLSLEASKMLGFIFYSLLFSAIYGIIMVLRKKMTVKTEMAFAPFMLLGYLYTMIYFNIFGGI